MTRAPTSSRLAGRRVLIVEDRYLIAAELADDVARMGCTVVGPAPDVASGARLAQEQDVQMALLDVNLDGEMVFPLAESLAERGVPFIFLSGYDGESLPSRWRDRPQLAKPVRASALRDELEKLAGSRVRSR